MEIEGISGEWPAYLIYSRYLAPSPRTEEDPGPETLSDEALLEALEAYRQTESFDEFLHRVDLLA